MVLALRCDVVVVNKPKLLSYSFLVALHASSAPFAAASQFHAKSTQYCHLEAFFPSLDSQLSEVLQRSNSSEEVRNAIKDYYNAARDIGNSANDIEIIEEIGDFLSQFYSSFKANESPEFKPNNCSSLSSSGAFLAEVDSRYESYLLEIKRKVCRQTSILVLLGKKKMHSKNIF